ncbi:MAG: type IV pilin N-terminal domain-containing protein [Methanoregulaceae archaeon]|jgi:FlaG/FlaF family flagellin (archaellin)
MIERKEDAVSPVVGVMLMLVVTIIIAAIVSGFAGGLAGGTEKAPQAAIDVKIEYGDAGMGSMEWVMSFEHLGGDPILTKDLALINYWTNSTGYTYREEQKFSSELVDTWPADETPIYGSDYVMMTRVPYLNDLSKGWASEPQMHFGNFTWMSGDTMSTGTTAGTVALLGIDDGSGGFSDSDFGEGSVVDVKILHVPSNGFIFDKEVVAL